MQMDQQLRVDPEISLEQNLGIGFEPFHENDFGMLFWWHRGSNHNNLIPRNSVKLVSPYLQCVTIEFRQDPIYVVNFQFSMCPDRC